MAIGRRDDPGGRRASWNAYRSFLPFSRLESTTETGADPPAIVDSSDWFSTVTVS